MSVEAEMGIGLVELGPMRVASCRYIGEHPEDRAFDGLFKWIAKKSLLAAAGQRRFFGVNHPNPTEGDPVYGLEAWITVDADVESDNVITIKEVPGGLYAVVRAPELAWPWVREHFGAWTEDSGYEYDAERQSLEEHFADRDDLVESIRVGREPKWIAFGECLPVKPAGERGPGRGEQ